MRIVGTLLQFVGGAIGRVFGAALVIGMFFILVGVTPWEYAVNLIMHPRVWMTSTWFRLGILILGLALIWFALTFNRWSQKQKIIDSLAEDISWAIDNLLNRPGPEAESLRNDFRKWCDGVSSKLQNRAFFTRADQLHFDYLGFVAPVVFYNDPALNKIFSELRIKIDRLWSAPIRWSGLNVSA